MREQSHTIFHRSGDGSILNADINGKSFSMRMTILKLSLKKYVKLNLTSEIPLHSHPERRRLLLTIVGNFLRYRKEVACLKIEDASGKIPEVQGTDKVSQVQNKTLLFVPMPF